MMRRRCQVMPTTNSGKIMPDEALRQMHAGAPPGGVLPPLRCEGWARFVLPRLPARLSTGVETQQSREGRNAHATGLRAAPDGATDQEGGMAGSAPGAASRVSGTLGERAPRTTLGYPSALSRDPSHQTQGMAGSAARIWPSSYCQHGSAWIGGRCHAVGRAAYSRPSFCPLRRSRLALLLLPNGTDLTDRASRPSHSAQTGRTALPCQHRAGLWCLQPSQVQPHRARILAGAAW